MEITREFLKGYDVCEDGYQWWLKNCEDLTALDQIEKVKSHRLDWANWLVTRLLDKTQKAKYAVFAADRVIDIFEKKYPDDKRPCKAIEAAKKYIENPSGKNAADAADAAAYAAYAAAYAYSAAYAADAAYAAVDAAAYAAYAASVAD